ncbi:MAG: hypothetical protein M1824_004665 [Vezdaea acicularis]|nr:MAG: hypothetical protein M1824_004665 [Vezdaea acicularis]
MAPRGPSTFGRRTAKEKSLDAQLQHDIARGTADEFLKPSRKRSYGEGVTPQQEDPDSIQADASDGDGETNNSSVRERQVKRSRSSEWPLPVPDQMPVQSVSNTLRRSKIPTGSPSSQRRRHASNRLQEPRSSAFLEGSMNDRVSKVPPVDFTLGDYSKSQSDLLAGQSKEQYDAGIAADNKRQTNIFRFGRSIAAAVSSVFNFRKESSTYTQDGMDEDDRDLKAQKLKAEKVYKELKDQGKLRGLATMPPTKVGVAHKAGSQSTASLLQPNFKRDSGVDVGELRYSEDGKRGKHSFADDAALLIPPSTFGASSKEPESDASSPRKSAFSFRRPSLVNLKKAKSVANLSAAEDKQGSLGPESALSDATEQPVTRNTLKKKPSKKDLQKEQKLRKRVSDLEVKVESARRELAKFRGEDLPPVPSLPSHVASKLEGFQRTQLYSLPSERLLKLPAHELAQHSESHDAQASDAYFTSAESPTKAAFRGDVESGLTHESLAVDKAVLDTVEDSQELDGDPAVSQASLQRPQELPKLAEEPNAQEMMGSKVPSKVAPIRKMLPKKRKSNDEDGVFKPEPESDEDDKEDEEEEEPVRRTRTSRRGRRGSYGIFPKKSQKFATGDSPGTRRRNSGAEVKKENIKPAPTTPPRRAWRPPGQAEKVCSPQPSGNFTVCSPGSSKGNPIEVSEDDALADKERKQPADPRSSNRNSKGKDMSSLSELGHSQRDAAQAVVISRVATPARRVNHQRSRSVSPAKPGLAQSLSPPPSLSYSKPTTARSSVEDDVISVVPDTGTVPAMPSLPLEFVAAGKQKSSGAATLTKAAAVSTGKKSKVEADPSGGLGTGRPGESQMMEIKREEYEWPEDVF